MRRKSDRGDLALKLGLIFVVGICFILLSESLAPQTEVGRALTLEVGVGLIAGLVIAVTIETYMRNIKLREDIEWQERIAENVFEALFGTALPPKLVSEMYQLLLVPAFLRLELEVKFKFRELTSEEQAGEEQAGGTDSDLLVLTQSVSFQAKNITGKQTTFAVHPKEYMVLRHASFSTPFKELSITGRAGEVRLDSPDKINEQLELSDGTIWHYLKEQSVPVPRGEKVDVCVVVERVCRREDSKSWITQGAAERLTVVVEFCDRALYDEMEFALYESCRVPLARSATSGVRSSMCHQWISQQPILAYQGFVLFWRKKSVPDV